MPPLRCVAPDAAQDFKTNLDGPPLKEKYQFVILHGYEFRLKQICFVGWCCVRAGPQ